MTAAAAGDLVVPDLADVGSRATELGVRLALVVGVIVISVVVARLLSPAVRALLSRRGRPSYTAVFSGLFRVAVVLVGILFALTLAFPSVRVADVLAIFGIASVAAGFAFKDTFENLLAGVLLLLRDPFKSGDQVTIADREGLVEGVTVRETLLRGHDGHRYFIPNAEVMTGVIDVETHRTTLRQSFRLHLGADADLPAVRSILTEAIATAAGVAPEPRPAAMVVDVVGGEVVVECRFWTGSRRSASTAARGEAIEAAVTALRRAGVELPVDELRVLGPRAAGAE